MVQAEAFREHSLEWTALQYSALGISSQSPDWLHKWSGDLTPPYDLASDFYMKLANQLGLGIATAAGARFYERHTLIAGKGRLRAVFDSVVDRPGREAVRVTEWLNQASHSV
jgi:peroxiredoxin